MSTPTLAQSRVSKPFDTGAMSPELRTLIDRVIVPALLERFLREHASRQSTPETPAA